MAPSQSIRSILVAQDSDFENLFDNLNSLARSVAKSANDLKYRYPSKTQALSAYQGLNEIAAAASINQAWFDKHHDQIATSIRAAVYDQGSVAPLLGTFVWIRRAVISELLSTIYRITSTADAVSLLTLVRSILENIGSAILLEKDLTKLLESTRTTPKEKHEAIAIAAEKITLRGKGTRIDWENYFSTSLRQGPKKSYRPKKDEVNQEAQGLLNGVDALDKHVKGSRKAYEFLSEFAHPNIGVHNLLISSTQMRELADEIVLYERKYVLGSPVAGIQIFHRQIKEVLEILIDSVEHFQTLSRNLDNLRLKLTMYTKSVVKTAMRNHPLAFVLREPCPCLSGNMVRDCCGTGIRKIHKKHGLD